ncbi:transposase [Pseudomonas sp.]|uniref:transposase n=1 Tax=Pseudomonas sp. TaxID=306 RepID=UPI004053C4D3
MVCRACGEHPPIKSNTAIAEERSRFLGALFEGIPPSCPDASCINNSIAISKEHYQSFGATRSGSRRYRCKACNKTFSVGKSTTGHKQPHKNRLIFSLLMNKSPLRRICEVADIGPEGLYGKIDFLYAQTKAFAANREKRLLNGMAFDRLYLCTDRQDYVVNWTQHQDRRNVVLHAVGTADLNSRYVFGMHLNYDPALNAELVEKDAQSIGDYTTKAPFRRYARCWLKGDYDALVRAKAAGRHKPSTHDLQQSIEATYAACAQRDDVEVSEGQDSSKRLPAKGVQIHAEYSLYGHFFFLRTLFGGVEKLRFFVDQDSGMRAACLAAFQPEITARKADAFYVRIAKERTISEKRQIIAASRAEFEKARQANPEMADMDIENLLIKERIAQMATLGKWQDKWLTHPFPNMSDPERAACYLTDFGDYDPDHLARLYNKASLHAIDSFFMQVRRRLSILERPISSASSAGRTWYGYSAYNPAQIVKMLGIFRVFYNYCLAGQDGNTPAIRLGLAKGKIALEDIIYFNG